MEVWFHASQSERSQRYFSSANVTPSVFALRDYSKPIWFELPCFHLHVFFCRRMKTVVVRDPNSEDLNLFTDLSLMWSLVLVPLLFSSISLKMGKKPLVLQGLSGCLVNVCYTPRDSLTKDNVEVVVLLWGLFSNIILFPPPSFKYLSSPAICWNVCFPKISACGLQVWGQLKRALQRTPEKNVIAQLCVS